MESPYRLKKILGVINSLAPERKIYIPYNMTLEDERIFYGKPERILKELENNNIEKGEFLVFIE